MAGVCRHHVNSVICSLSVYVALLQGKYLQPARDDDDERKKKKKKTQALNSPFSVLFAMAYYVVAVATLTISSICITTAICICRIRIRCRTHSTHAGDFSVGRNETK